MADKKTLPLPKTTTPKALANTRPTGARVGIPVRAKAAGVYGHVRRRIGAEFTIANEQELGSWMERLDRPAVATSAVETPLPATETGTTSTDDVI